MRPAPAPWLVAWGGPCYNLAKLDNIPQPEPRRERGDPSKEEPLSEYSQRHSPSRPSLWPQQQVHEQ